MVCAGFRGTSYSASGSEGLAIVLVPLAIGTGSGVVATVGEAGSVCCCTGGGFGAGGMGVGGEMGADSSFF